MNIDALKNELLLQNWDDVMGSTDVNMATFVNLYDKHCPVKKICSNLNGNKIKPWFTTGLRNACKKKITYTGCFCSAEQKVLRIGTKCTQIS